MYHLADNTSEHREYVLRTAYAPHCRYATSGTWQTLCKRALFRAHVWDGPGTPQGSVWGMCKQCAKVMEDMQRTIRLEQLRCKYCRTALGDANS